LIAGWAECWLPKELKDRGLPSETVIALGRECGFSESTLQRARPLAGVIIEQKGFREEKKSTWSLKAAAIEEPDFSGVLRFFWEISAEFTEKSARRSLIFLGAT
jgi:hypothetical protein